MQMKLPANLFLYVICIRFFSQIKPYRSVSTVVFMSVAWGQVTKATLLTDSFSLRLYCNQNIHIIAIDPQCLLHDPLLIIMIKRWLIFQPESEIFCHSLMTPLRIFRVTFTFINISSAESLIDFMSVSLKFCRSNQLKN